VRAGNIIGWSAYSIWKTFTVGPPAAPTPLTPSGTITTGNPTFTWTRPAGVTKYALYVYTNATPSVLKFASSAITPTCNASTCSYTPTLNLTAGSYKWRVRAGNASGWSAYSTWLNFALSAPAAPTPLSPSGTITIGNPTFTWTKPAGVTKYALYVYTTANVVKFANYVTPACGTSTCSYTPTLNLAVGSYKWAVKAGNTFGWSAYSAWLNFSVSNDDIGFNSQFNGDSTGWQAHWGSWSILNGAYYYTNGLSESWSSTSYAASYTNFDYQASFIMYSGDEVDQGFTYGAIIFRGTPGSYGTDHQWNNTYVFKICIPDFLCCRSYNVSKIVAGTTTYLTGWMNSSYIGRGWNTLRVRAVGTTLNFYINGNLVFTTIDSSLASGRVGLEFGPIWLGHPSSYRADWATLSVLSGSSDTIMDVISPAQLALNEAANKDPKNMLNPAYYIPPK
jgi:hypothetical protein